MWLLNNALGDSEWQPVIVDLQVSTRVSGGTASKFFHHFFYVLNGIAI